MLEPSSDKYYLLTDGLLQFLGNQASAFLSVVNKGLVGKETSPYRETIALLET